MLLVSTGGSRCREGLGESPGRSRHKTAYLEPLEVGLLLEPLTLPRIVAALRTSARLPSITIAIAVFSLSLHCADLLPWFSLLIVFVFLYFAVFSVVYYWFGSFYGYLLAAFRPFDDDIDYWRTLSTTLLTICLLPNWDNTL